MENKAKNNVSSVVQKITSERGILTEKDLKMIYELIKVGVKNQLPRETKISDSDFETLLTEMAKITNKIVELKFQRLNEDIKVIKKLLRETTTTSSIATTQVPPQKQFKLDSPEELEDAETEKHTKKTPKINYEAIVGKALKSSGFDIEANANTPTTPTRPPEELMKEGSAVLRQIPQGGKLEAMPTEIKKEASNAMFDTVLAVNEDLAKSME